MSIDVLWEEMDWESKGPGPVGTRVLEVVRDDHSLVERLLSNFRGGFPYLSFIGHDTATFFHQEHIPQLARELEALSEQAHEPELEDHLQAVLNLVWHALGSKDTLIAFRARRNDA